jgi:glycerol uptake facilitator-like aquaporin
MLVRQLVAEGLGTAILVATVVGSGIMGDRLSGGNAGIALLANTLATGAALFALLSALGPVSGAHLNPIVTVSSASQGGMPWSSVPGYVLAQIGGGLAGACLANTMFGSVAVTLSTQERSGWPLLLSEFVATFGLLAVIWGCVRRNAGALPGAVAAYIAAACWFTPSTAFANPAVTVARALTDSFAGIRPVDVPGFVAAQVLGGAGATVLFRWLTPPA